jgi:asparagine synthase (glutamine-hydrolysing)
MCGICGKFNYLNQAPVNENLLRDMCSVLQHRGPDDETVYIDGYMGLGHRRLSIIDLEGGQQPMSNEDQTCWVICNGEIYNFKQLRRELQHCGHQFRTRSDTEVILHLYEEQGIACVKQLRGMFAFALWDMRQKRLFLARDRLGQKPLVYTQTKQGLMFASEIKSLLQDPQITPEVDLAALHHYLTYQYVPSPYTIFRGIHKLPPAHTLVCEQGKTTIERYWELRFKYDRLSEQEYMEESLRLLKEATDLRLVSDVPLGAFLSGGIDSSAVVGTMAQLCSRPVKTFSIGFEEEAFNELEHARVVARHFGTEHQEFIVKTDALEVLPKLIWHYNEPFADPSAIPSYYVAKIARQHVTVALNGDAGDESFAGYERYIAERQALFYQRIPAPIRHGLIEPLSRLLPQTGREQALPDKVRRFICTISSPFAQRYLQLICAFNNQQKQAIYSPEMKRLLDNHDSLKRIQQIYDEAPAPDPISSALYVDLMNYLPDDLLVKMDIATMANSLEGRSPFLDHKLMEFTATIPWQLKLKGTTTKYILRKALTKLLPSRILHRKKAGFSVPISNWLRHELRDFAQQTLLDKRCTQRGYFNPESIKKLLEQHLSGHYDHGFRLWTLLNLELWHQTFIDKINKMN